MSILTLNNITQQFGDKILYEGVDLQLNAGEHIWADWTKRSR